MGDIRDLKQFAAGRWAYDRHGYSKAFGGSITPSDIDSVVERNRQFLFIEHKEYVENKAPFHLPDGQRIMLRRLAELPGVTVVYVSGIAETGDPRYIRSICGKQDDDTVFDLRSVGELADRKQAMFDVLAHWWNMAEAKK